MLFCSSNKVCFFTKISDFFYLLKLINKIIYLANFSLSLFIVKMADELCPRLYLSGSYRQCYNLLSASNCILIFLLFYIIVSELEKERKMLSFRDTLIMINNKLTCQLKVCSL